MNKIAGLIVFQLFYSLLFGQYKEFPKLQQLYESEKYDKCIEKAEGYAEDNPKEPLPYLYMMKCWLAIDEQPEHEEHKKAITKALAAGKKTFKKDKKDVLFDEFIPDFELLHTKAYEKAEELEKDGKCSRAIKMYDDIQEIYRDRLSNYKKSLCMLQETNMQQDGFVLLRNTMIGVYADYKKGISLPPVPQGFARASHEYLERGYFINAEDMLRKGIEVFPGDTAIRTELVRQVSKTYSSYIQSDFRADLTKLRNKLLWADSAYKHYTPVVQMLKTTHQKTIVHYIKFEYSGIDSLLLYINSCQQLDTAIYSADSINIFLTGLYQNGDVRRVEGALENLTNTLIKLNTPIAQKAKQHPAQYVFDKLLLQNNYEVAAYFIKQTRGLYPKDKKMLDGMTASLENKLVEILTNAPKEIGSLDLAEKFTAMAPANKKLPAIEKQLYHHLLQMQVADNSYSLFFITANRGLRRFPADPAMMKLKKDMVVQDFNNNFTPNLLTSFAETKVISHVPTCTPGKVDSMANLKFMKVLNYLRRQAGVYDSCFLDAELNEMCQLAALMMKGQDDLSHEPDDKWKCFSKKGKRAAGSSNLSLGNWGTAALLSQMRDEGMGNHSVGHRRWVLNPHNNVFGHGSTDNSMCLWVFGKYYNNPEKDKKPVWNDKNFIAWPPADYAPLALVPIRWSFSLVDADFSKAQITVTLKGKKVITKPEALEQGYAVNTCVWRMTDSIKPGDVYTITISGIAIAGETKTKSFTYKTEILDLE